jgi:ubiquinone/menaquinone biosynthesis C-methylase UbiE
LVTGGDAFARTVFSEERRGYWAGAVTLVLEKHGVLGVELLPPSVLEDTDELNRFDAILVARLPKGVWTPALAAKIADGAVPVLVEGPLDGPCAELLGIEVVGAVEHRGWISPVTDALAKLVTRYVPTPFGEVGETIGRPHARPAELEWSVLDTSLSEEQAAAWQARGWEFDRWRVADGPELVADWTAADEAEDRFPAIVKRGALIASALSILSYLGQAHTSEPFPPGESRASPRAAGLEAILLALIDQMHASRGSTRARVLPWPAGGRWVRNVRHDYDRPLSGEQTQRVVERHAQSGSSVTWYWRARHAGDEGLGSVVAAEGHELALHTERTWDGAEREREVIERASGGTLVGTSAHGSPDCSRFQGAPNVLWADRQGLLYTELLQHRHLHPHRFAFLGRDGTVRPLRVICLPHHESLDRSTTSTETFVEDINRALPTWIACGGLCQVMNHPDLNQDELFQHLDSMPSEGRLDWTARQAVEWWLRTHVSGELAMRALGRGRFALEARQQVDGLVIELLEPDGTRTEQALDLEPGRRVVVSSSEVIADWDSASRVFGDAIRAHHAARGRNASTPSVVATIRTNTELVPKRADNVVRLLTQMTGGDLSGLRVLELGSGFGALATYLAWARGPAELVATDIQPDFVETGRLAAERLGLDDRLSFVTADMRQLSSCVGEETFDVLIANNSFIYLPTAPDVAEALAEFHRVLRPGGRVLFYHANKWRRTEPFTGDPLVHLLPPRIARPAARIFGWRHNHGRVRLISPPELRRRLRRAGFDDVRIVGIGDKRRTDGARRYFANFYALSARRSA